MPATRPRSAHVAPRTRWGAALLLVALLAAACGGGGGEPDASGPTEPASAEPAPTGDASGRSGTSSGSPTGAGSAALSDWSAGAANVVQPDPGEVEFEATFAPETVIVDPSAVLEAGDDHTYLLDASSLSPGSELRPGSVLLIPGVALRRVTDVTDADGRVAVSTEFAALTDAIVDGDISWDVALPTAAQFQTDPDATPSPAPSPDEQAAPSSSGAVELDDVGVILPDGSFERVAWQVTQDGDLPLKWTYQDGPLSYLFALGVGVDHLDVQVQVKRDVGGNTALTYTATGQVANPRAVGDIQIRDGKLTAAAIEQQGLKGRLELDVAAAGAGSAKIDFELPGIWFRYVIPVGPIPVTVGVNARVIGNIEVPAQASATASATYTFGGDVGFKLEETSVVPSVRMPDLGIVPVPADSGAMIGSSVDTQFGLAFPHMSISLFDQGVVPRVYPGAIIGSRLQWGPICKSAYVTFVVQGAYDFKILGVNLHQSERIDLIEPYTNQARNEGCPPE